MHKTSLVREAVSSEVHAVLFFRGAGQWRVRDSRRRRQPAASSQQQKQQQQQMIIVFARQGPPLH
eukprot:11157649-Lingulodinium_polyedra.AAC.1